MGLNIFKNEDLTKYLDNTIPVFNQPYITYLFKWNFLYFSVCPLPPILSVIYTEKSTVLFSLLLPIRNLKVLLRFFLSLLFSKLNIPALLSMHSRACIMHPVLQTSTLKLEILPELQICKKEKLMEARGSFIEKQGHNIFK